MIVGRKDRIPQYCAYAIASIALRECRVLDELWAQNNCSTCDPLRKRRHRQFLTSLLGFYFCMTERFLNQKVPGSLESLLSSIIISTAIKAAKDPVLDKPPFFLSDRMDKRFRRYRSQIQSARESMLTKPSYEDLISASAGELARTALPDAPLAEIVALASQLERRLRWTSSELLGSRVMS